MAKGENAERLGHCGRDYWSRRIDGVPPWGPVGKWITHRKERAAKRREEHRAKQNAIAGEKD